MRFNREMLMGLVALGAALLPASMSSAAFVPWSTTNGSNSFMSWSGGGSTDGIWGDPIINGTTLTFNPSEFRAESNSGVSDTVDGLLRFNLDIAQGSQITGFSISEIGSYSILDGGSVKATGMLLIQDRDTGLNYFDTMDSGDTSPNFPVSTNGSVNGAWTGSMSVLDMPDGITRVTITVDNTLQATSFAPGLENPTGGTSFIDKKAVGGGVVISIFVPEPGTMGLLLCGAPLLIRRRKA